MKRGLAQVNDELTVSDLYRSKDVEQIMERICGTGLAVSKFSIKSRNDVVLALPRGFGPSMLKGVFPCLLKMMKLTRELTQNRYSNLFRGNVCIAYYHRS